MQAIRFGRIIRALRRRRGWRQLDLAARGRCSQQTISRLERGDLEGVALGTIQRVLAVLEADLDLVIRSARSGGPPPHRVRRPDASSAEHEVA